MLEEVCVCVCVCVCGEEGCPQAEPEVTGQEVWVEEARHEVGLDDVCVCVYV